jgi:hypothetical protein
VTLRVKVDERIDVRRRRKRSRVKIQDLPLDQMIRKLDSFSFNSISESLAPVEQIEASPEEMCGRRVRFTNCHLDVGRVSIPDPFADVPSL